MAEYQINLKYNGIDDWQDLSVNSHDKDVEYKEIVQENADGNKSYLAIGSPIFTDNLDTPVTDQYQIKKIFNYLVSTNGIAEIKVDGAIYNAKIKCNYNKNVENLFKNVVASFSVEKINE